MAGSSQPPVRHSERSEESLPERSGVPLRHSERSEESLPDRSQPSPCHSEHSEESPADRSQPSPCHSERSEESPADRSQSPPCHSERSEESRWKRYVVGGGALESAGPLLRFVVAAATSRQYSDAQIDDYQGLPRRRFPWHPPLRLTVRARFSHPSGELRGTAGFGFWNDPFLMTGARWPALPRAVWFFYGSPPSNMKLDLHTPGCGWKAATLDALHSIPLLLAPLAPLAVLLMNLRPLYRALWPPIQQALKVQEAALEVDMTAWHTYAVEWGTDRVCFSVDGEPVLADAPSPRGPLGFVTWLDNQYMVVTPQGRLGWGLLDVPGRQWMEVDGLEIGPLLRPGT